MLGGFPWFPITKDQITMLIEGNVCQSDGVYEMFNLIPTPFNSESLSYLKNAYMSVMNAMTVDIEINTGNSLPVKRW